MNPWAKKSAKLAAEQNYLDRLQEVYPSIPRDRSVPQGVLNTIKAAVQKRDRTRLLDILLKLDKFPYDESYKQFLKADPGAIPRNPKTVDRICSTLFKMGSEGIIAGVTAPKVPNTMRGSQFRKWAENNFRFLKKSKFVQSSKGIVFLDAPDEGLRNYANSELGSGLAKRPDFVAKSGTKHVVGEAKFLSNEGGNQNAGFRDAMGVAGHASGRAIKVAVLDGILWLGSSSYYRQIEISSVNVFSVLLLDEFLKSI